MVVGKGKEGSFSGEPPDEDAVTVDYRAWDDAWYDVELHLRGEVLTVKFCNLESPVCERLTSGMFQDYTDLELFLKKFRRNSRQLQGVECRRVHEGMKALTRVSGSGRRQDETLSTPPVISL